MGAAIFFQTLPGANIGLFRSSNKIFWGSGVALFDKNIKKVNKILDTLQFLGHNFQTVGATNELVNKNFQSI